MTGALFFVEFTQKHEKLLPSLPTILIIFLDIVIPCFIHKLAKLGVLELSNYIGGNDSHARV